MDIILQTNSENPSFAFLEFVRFGDGSGYCTKLAVRSGWISAEYNFYFESGPALEFLTDLEEIDRSLTGVARLKPTFEAQFIEFRGIGQGHIRILGDLIEHGPRNQHVRFEFETDQTCLRPFIKAFRQVTG